MNKGTKVILQETNITSEKYTDALDVSKYEGANVQLNLDVNTPSATDFLSGVANIDTATFDTKANTGDGDYLIITDTAGLEWAVAADLTGSSAEPTGALWLAIPAARKAQADISLATDAASVAAVFELAFDGLADVSFATDDSAADGTMLFTQSLRGVTAAPQFKNADDSGAGSISAVESTAGVDSEVDATANTMTMTAHGMATGLKGQLTTDGTLPDPLALTTDYFVIRVDANTIQLATSLANALAGTAIDLTDQGSSGGTHTFTATSLSGASYVPQKSIDGVNYEDIGSAVNITADATEFDEITDMYFNWIRYKFTATAGQFSAKVILCGGK